MLSFYLVAADPAPLLGDDETFINNYPESEYIDEEPTNPTSSGNQETQPTQQPEGDDCGEDCGQDVHGLNPDGRPDREYDANGIYSNGRPDREYDANGIYSNGRPDRMDN